MSDKTITFTIITIVTAIILVFLFNAFIRRILNFFTYFKKPRFSEASEKEHGLIYNKKTGKLEADQSIITPF